MKHFKLFLACMLMAVLSIGQVWAGIGSITFDFEDDGAHRASGSNSYTGSNSYSENSVDISCTYMDVVTTGTPLSGSANALGRVAKNTTNSPVLLIGPIDMTDKTITGITYYTKGVGTQSQVCEYSTNGSSWTTAVASFTMPTSSTQKSSGTISVAGTSTFYLRITTSVESSTGSNRDLQIDDVVISYSYEDGGTPTCATPTFSPAAGAVVSGTEVTISSTTDGATIYYTTDDTDPTTSSATTQPVVISANTTIKAIAVKEGNNNSAVATAEYTVVTPKTIAQVLSGISSTEGAELLLNDVTVTYAYGSNVYVKDATGYLMVYSSIAGAENGKVLHELWGKAKLYNNLPEISTVTKAPTVNDGAAVDPEALAAYPTDADLNKYVTLEDVTFAAAATLSGSVANINGTFDGSTLVLRNTFKLSGVSVETGKSYRVVGVVQKYNDTYQVYPITITEIVAAGAPEAPTFSPAAGTYTEVQNVTLSCATDGATIYYTTNGDTPDDGSTEYTGAISVNEDMTIKAVAYKAGVPSSIASAAYVINLPLTTMDAIFAKATAVGGTATDVTIVLNNWVVSGIYTNNKDVFVTDGTKGFLIYDNGASMGFNVGDVLSGTVACKVQLFKGAAEVTTLNSSTTGISITPDGSATLNTKTIDQLGAVNTGALVKIVNLSYNGTSKKLSDGVNEITPYNGLYAYTLEDGKTYNVTGIVGYYNTLQIMPRSAADIEEVTLDDPEISYDPASVILTTGDALSAPTLNNPHSLVISSYASDNESVATVTDGGVIALAGGTGTAVITAHTNGDATYGAGNATFTITVNAYDPRKKATLTSFALGGVFDVTDMIYAAYQGDAANPVYLSGTGDEMRLYKPATGKTTGGYIVINAVKGCTIDEVIVYNGSSKATTIGCSTTSTLATSGEAYAKNSSVSFESLDATVVYIDNIGSDRMDIKKIEVFYTGDAAAVDHYELGGTYQTDFEIGDAFNHDGLEVYMAYDAGGTEKLEITPACTFSEPDMSIAGTPTVNITFAGGVVKTYDITVAASALLDPELSYDPTSVTLTQGDALTAPTFNNPHTLSPITYNSNKTAVATVDEFGVITLAGGTGTATITASFAGDATYQAGNATFTITVNEPAEDLSGTWELATSVAAGDRIIIASIADAGAVTTMGAQNGNNRSGVASTVAGTVLTPAEGSKSVTLVDAGEGKFALLLNNGSYLYAASNTNNYLKETAAYAENENAKWTISISEGVATITAQGTNSHNLMRFNPNSGSPLFNCYTSSSTTGTLVTIYKKAVAAPVADYTRNDSWIAPGELGTVCISHGVATIVGANIYQLAGKQAGGNVVFESVATMEPGKPYLFEATSDHVDFFFSAEAEAAVAGNHNGMYGTFIDMNIATDLANTYYFDGHTLYSAVDLASLEVKAYRAYIKMDEVPTMGASPAPGKRYITLNVNGANGTTGIGELNASETPVKMIIDGKMYILRGEKLYNANGQLVK